MINNITAALPTRRAFIAKIGELGRYVAVLQLFYCVVNHSVAGLRVDREAKDVR